MLGEGIEDAPGTAGAGGAERGRVGPDDKRFGDAGLVEVGEDRGENRFAARAGQDPVLPVAQVQHAHAGPGRRNETFHPHLFCLAFRGLRPARAGCCSVWLLGGGWLPRPGLAPAGNGAEPS
jgi:hypothetical protein